MDALAGEKYHRFFKILIGEKGESSVPLPNVLAIIVNWNGGQCIIGTVKAAFQSTYSNLQVLVVDNASSDGSPDMMSEFRPVHLLRLAENRGYATAVNAGLASDLAREAAFYLCMNNDVLLEPSAVDESVSCARCNPGFGVLSPLIIEASGRIGCSGVFFTHLGWWEPYRIDPECTSQEVKELDIVEGAAMFIRKEVVQSIGGFDPAFFLYRENIDFCKRARDAGFRVGVSIFSRATHIGGGTTRPSVPLSSALAYREESAFDSRRVYSESFIKYAFKHLGPFELIRWLATGRGRASWSRIPGMLPGLIRLRRRRRSKIDVLQA